MQTTLFYVLGIGLVLSALTLSALGLRNERFPSPGALRAGIAFFVVLVGAVLTFAVLESREDQKKRRENLAAEKTVGPAAENPAGGQAPSPPAKPKGPGGTLKLAADPTGLVFDTKTLTSKPGKVTIDFTNPSALQHDVVIQKGSTDLAKTDLISKSSASVSADLGPGTYSFYCNVPGHRQAGMEGTLTVK